MKYENRWGDQDVFEACVTAILAAAVEQGQHVVVLLCNCDPNRPHGTALGFFQEDAAVVEVAKVCQRIEGRNKAISAAPHVMLWYGEKPGQWTLWEEHHGQWPYNKTLNTERLRYVG